jgi:hypothetical protein
MLRTAIAQFFFLLARSLRSNQLFPTSKVQILTPTAGGVGTPISKLEAQLKLAQVAQFGRKTGGDWPWLHQMRIFMLCVSVDLMAS